MCAKVPIGTTSQWALLQAILCPGPKTLFYAQQLVVFACTLGAANGTGLYLAGVYGNGKVGNEGVLCLSATVGNDAGIAMPLSQRNSF